VAVTRAHDYEPTPPTRPALVAYAIARAVVVGVSRLAWSVEVIGAEKVPAEGACVVAPAHRSYIDTLVVAAISHRRLRYMGKDTVWKWRPVAWLLSALGGFPVHRGLADRDALRRCRVALEGGEPLVLFPEGQRGSGPVIGPLFEGAAYLALHVGVPLVPVGIGGSERAMPKGARWPRRAKVVLVVGDPLPIRPLEGRVPRRLVEETTTALRERLQELFEEAERRAEAPGGRRSVRRGRTVEAVGQPAGPSPADSARDPAPRAAGSPDPDRPSD
jgi:1-acyl-sn-glycerol-3-phosphate acyltransferase